MYFLGNFVLLCLYFLANFFCYCECIFLLTFVLFLVFFVVVLCHFEYIFWLTFVLCCMCTFVEFSVFFMYLLAKIGGLCCRLMYFHLFILAFVYFKTPQAVQAFQS